MTGHVTSTPRVSVVPPSSPDGLPLLQYSVPDFSILGGYHWMDCVSFARRKFATPKIRTFATPKFGLQRLLPETCSTYLIPSSWRRLPMQMPETPAPSTITWKSGEGGGEVEDRDEEKNIERLRPQRRTEVVVQPLRRKMRGCRVLIEFSYKQSCSTGSYQGQKQTTLLVAKSSARIGHGRVFKAFAALACFEACGHN